MTENNNNKILTFEQLQLDKWLLDTLAKLQIKEPTLVQNECISRVMNGEDVVAISKTGSGKTACFALPILNLLAKEFISVYAIIIEPTRELAIQTSEQLSIFGDLIGLKTLVLTGGNDYIKQQQDLDTKPHIIVTTPGRLAEYINNFSNEMKNLLKSLKFVVYDEADILLSNSHSKYLNIILDFLNTTKTKDRQTLMFTATTCEAIEKYVLKKNPFVFNGYTKQWTNDQLLQQFMLVPSYMKELYLVYLLNMISPIKELNKEIKNFEKKPKSIIIFTKTCELCELLTKMLNNIGFKSKHLHSVLKQKERVSNLDVFRNCIANILVCTNVASRGLDIPLVDYVINYDVPNNSQIYVHRVGRTARINNKGTAITLVDENQTQMLLKIEKNIGAKLKEIVPDEHLAMKLINKVAIAKRCSKMHIYDSKFKENLKRKRKEVDPLIPNKNKT